MNSRTHIKTEKSCYIYLKTIENNMGKKKKNCKVRDNCNYTVEYSGAAHSICNWKYSLPKNNPIDFHNGLDYDYLFIINKLAEEFEKQFTCLGQNIEKYIAFIVPIVNPIKDELFRGCSRMRVGGGRGEAKRPPSLKSFTHIQQWWNLAQLYLT